MDPEYRAAWLAILKRQEELKYAAERAAAMERRSRLNGKKS